MRLGLVRGEAIPDGLRGVTLLHMRAKARDRWVNEGGDVGFRGGGPGGLAGRTGMLSWRARRKQETARREKMWREFAWQSGTHLRWVAAGIRRGELRTAEQQTIAAVRWTFRSGLEDRVTVSAGGRSFTVNKMKIPNPGNPRSWPPGTAEIIRQPETSSEKITRAVRARLKTLRELVDETGTPVLYTYGKHRNHHAEACITFPDRRRLEFPVWGTFKKADAIMTAVDQDRNRVARYRVAPQRAPRALLFDPAVEITVHPDWTLTDELVLVIAISAPWLQGYFVQ